MTRREYAQAYRKTAAGASSCAWNRLTARAGAKYGYSKCYSGIEVKITRTDFIAWAIPQYKSWFAEYPGITPSIDRIDSNGDYEINNLRLLSRYDNIQAASWYKNRIAPRGMAWCGSCKSYLLITRFWKDRQKKNGLGTYCMDCLRVKRKKSIHV